MQGESIIIYKKNIFGMIKKIYQSALGIFLVFGIGLVGLTIILTLLQAIKLADILGFVYSVGMPTLLMIIIIAILFSLVDMYKWLVMGNEVKTDKSQIYYKNNIIKFTDIYNVKKSITRGKYSSFYNGTIVISYLESGVKKKCRLYLGVFDDEYHLLHQLEIWNIERHKQFLRILEEDVINKRVTNFENDVMRYDANSNLLFIKKKQLLNKEILKNIVETKRFRNHTEELSIKLDRKVRVKLSFFDLNKNQPLLTKRIQIEGVDKLFFFNATKPEQSIALIQFLYYLKQENKIDLSILVFSVQKYF